MPAIPIFAFHTILGNACSELGKLTCRVRLEVCAKIRLDPRERSHNPSEQTC